MFNKRVLELDPYVISKRFTGQREGEWLFLDWNETTYPVPECIKKKLIDAINQGVGARYPDGDCDYVSEEIGKYVGLNRNNVLVFNGSDSALKDCIECILDPGDIVSIVEPEYSQINTYVQMASGIVKGVRLVNPMKFQVDELIDEIKKQKVLYISNPSNPTGRYLGRSEIVKILETGICLMLDEAYVEFAPESLSDLVLKYENLFIFRTFSKAFGLAGLRLGYLLSSEGNIRVLKKNQNSKEVNSLAQIAAVEALRNFKIYQDRINQIKKDRDSLCNFINGMKKNIEAYDSMANFVIIKTKCLDGILNFLEENKILIRDRRGMYFMDDSARISIGTHQEMEKVKRVFDEFFKNSKK